MPSSTRSAKLSGSARGALLMIGRLRQPSLKRLLAERSDRSGYDQLLSSNHDPRRRHCTNLSTKTHTNVRVVTTIIPDSPYATS